MVGAMLHFEANRNAVWLLKYISSSNYVNDARNVGAEVTLILAYYGRYLNSDSG